MKVSQKCQYALRAVFELARNYGKGPMKVSNIAEAQAIPPRFLEVILNQLKKGGFVDSRRGSEGGFFLVRYPRNMKVGEIIYFIDGPVDPVDCTAGADGKTCRLFGSCAFMEMWHQVGDAVSGIYDNTSIQDLLDRAVQTQELHYSI